MTENKCLQCGNLTKNSKFCSRSCAAKYNNCIRGSRSQNTKNKISESLKIWFSDNPKNSKVRTRICCICKKEFYLWKTPYGNWTRSSTCSEECRYKLFSMKNKQTYDKMLKENRIKPWRSRKTPSFPEQYWINVLDQNNIPYKREVFFKKYYFDFLIEKDGYRIDLEIDGKQHRRSENQKHDQERDLFLKTNNIIVYRISWNSIKSEHGKELMKNKIENFLIFLSNL